MGLFNKDLVDSTIYVEGIKCEHCIQKVITELKKYKVKCSIVLEEKLVKVSYNENKISLNKIKDIIDSLGYQCI